MMPYRFWWVGGTPTHVPQEGGQMYGKTKSPAGAWDVGEKDAGSVS